MTGPGPDGDPNQDAQRRAVSASGPGTEEATALALATGLVGLVTFAITLRLWLMRPPLALDALTLWTTILLLGVPLVGLYALTDAEVTALGFVRGDAERGSKYVLGAAVILVPVAVAVGLAPAMRGAWPHPAGAFGAVGVALVLAWRAFVLEWFFRGFLLFGLLRRIGSSAVFVQMVPFGLLYLGRPWPEALVAWPAGFVLGFIAWRSRSFLPSTLLHILAVLLLQAVSALRG